MLVGEEVLILTSSSTYHLTATAEQVISNSTQQKRTNSNFFVSDEVSWKVANCSNVREGWRTRGLRGRNTVKPIFPFPASTLHYGKVLFKLVIPWSLFHWSLVSSNNTILQRKHLKNDPCSIKYRDSIPQPLDRQSLPISSR